MILWFLIGFVCGAVALILSIPFAALLFSGKDDRRNLQMVMRCNHEFDRGEFNTAFYQTGTLKCKLCGKEFHKDQIPSPA